MATQTEKIIHSLELDIATLKERVELLKADRVPVRELTSQVAVLQQQLGEMTKTRELWPARLGHSDHRHLGRGLTRGGDSRRPRQLLHEPSEMTITSARRRLGSSAG